MIDVQIHRRGEPTERGNLPAVPAIGVYILDEAPGARLWQVVGVVLDGCAVNVYAIQLSPRLAGELVETWGEAGPAGEADQGDGDRCGRGAGCCRPSLLDNQARRSIIARGGTMTTRAEYPT